MDSFQLHGQQITFEYSFRGVGVAFKLYVDGDLRDESKFFDLKREWTTYVRAGVINGSGQKKELQIQGRKKPFYLLLGRWEIRRVYDGKVIDENGNVIE